MNIKRIAITLALAMTIASLPASAATFASQQIVSGVRVQSIFNS